ncbi:MAG: cysteine desulfurase [Euryarchaeota archaeon]|nr:cysteine desulfurase [Euryarchaeota archaeon]
MERIFFDNSSTTQVDERVLEAMLPYFRSRFGNPSSLHSFGSEAQDGIEKARELAAKAIGATPEEIFFTSGGTESDNLALQGTAYARIEEGRHMITSSVEHHAILHTCEFLERQGFEVTYLPVDKDGLVDPDALLKVIRKDTVLISIMAANNEIGTIQPIEEIGRIARDSGIAFHTDAVQAVTKMDIDVDRDFIDLLSMSAHKFHGPKGVGALYLRKGHKLRPMSYGGGQERGIRPSTENVPGIVGLGEAIRLSMSDMERTVENMTSMRDKVIEGTISSVEGCHLNGHRTKRLCNNANFRFDRIDGEALVLNLDYEGIATSTGSACSSRSSETSHVLKALGLEEKECKGSLRVTLGRMNTMGEVERYLTTLPQVIKRLRGLAPSEVFSMERSEAGTCRTTER